ncbi:ABC transporter permease [Oceanobacillus sp. M65]|uniref:ABC transporter permease n=1 Tax=Oceanobacillus sp. M65 TaxID=3457435 RepID=UPI0025712CD6
MKKKKQLLLLINMNMKELIRNPMTFFMVLAFPFLFVIMFGVISSTTGTDMLEFIIPGIIVMAFFTLAINGTSIPIIQMREKGTLRLIGLTEVNKITFVVSQITARFLLATIQLLILLGVAYVKDMLLLENIIPIIIVSVIGLTMLFALGYLTACLNLSVEAVSGISGGILAPLLIFCGLFMPLTLLPSWIETLSKFIPLTYFGELLRFYLNGEEPSLGILTSYLVLILVTLLLVFLSSRLFRWEKTS